MNYSILLNHRLVHLPYSLLALFKLIILLYRYLLKMVTMRICYSYLRNIISHLKKLSSMIPLAVIICVTMTILKLILIIHKPLTRFLNNLIQILLQILRLTLYNVVTKQSASCLL